MAEQTVRIDGVVPTSPTGTQNVAITSPTAFPVTDNGGSLTVDGTVASYVTTNPAFTGGYVWSGPMIPGVVAGNNYLTLTNPVGSGKTILIAGVFISQIIVGDTTGVIDPLRGWLATAVSGGTLQAASTIGKIRSSMVNPAGEIRTGNPAATLGAAWFNSPPLIGASKTSAPFIHQVPSTIQAGSLSLLAGESTVLRTESGDVDQRWNLSIAWSE